MTGIITTNFRQHNADQFYEMFSEADPTVLYFFISKSTQWGNDNSPPDPTDTVENTEYSVWDNMLALKRINASDVTYTQETNQWVSGTVYDEYSSTTDFFSAKNFFVQTEDYHIYKCISNNNGAQSTVKPSGTLTTIIKTADGYRWKYLFTISASDALKFVTNAFFPVKVLTSNDGTQQWQVQQAAVDGSIDHVEITTGGTGYLYNTGFVQSVVTTSIVIDPSASSTNDVYNNYSIYIESGTGAGQIRTITDYVGASRTITVSSAFSPQVDATSTYIVSPTVSVVDPTGIDFKAYTTVAAGAITDVSVIDSGEEYRKPVVTVLGDTGTGGVLSAVLSPKGGHGSNAVKELFAHNVMANVKLTGAESGSFMVGNDYRIVGLIRNPLLPNDSAATGSVYRQTTELTLSGISGSFVPDEVITGGTSGSTANYIYNVSNTVIAITNTSDDFGTEVITGGTSGSTATIDSISDPELKKYSGEVMYIENRVPIVRASDQNEDIKISIRY